MSWFDNKKHATNLKIFIEKKKKKLTFHIKLMSENSKEFFLNNIKNQNQNQNQNQWRYVNVGSLLFRAMLAQAYFL